MLLFPPPQVKLKFALGAEKGWVGNWPAGRGRGTETNISGKTHYSSGRRLKSPKFTPSGGGEKREGVGGWGWEEKSGLAWTEVGGGGSVEGGGWETQSPLSCGRLFQEKE